MRAIPQLEPRALILPLGKDSAWSFLLDPKEVLDVIGDKPKHRFMIWAILAGQQEIGIKHYCRVQSVLTAVLVELRKSGWIEHEAAEGRVWYRRTIQQSLAGDYPFSSHFLDKLRRTFGLPTG